MKKRRFSPMIEAYQLYIHNYIETIFTDILNSSFSSGEFPDSEKYAVVRPLLKAGKDRDELSSYRPLYNTSFLSKVLETACLKQLNGHLNKMPAASDTVDQDILLNDLFALGIDDH